MFQYVILVLLALFSTLPWRTPRPSSNHTRRHPFFHPAVGACGDTNTVLDFVVAVSFDFFIPCEHYSYVGPQTSGNPICDRRIQATAPGEKTVTVTVKDKCAACTHFDLDMSPAAFDQLADRSVGRIHAVKWHLL
ncbi:hypothetical protein JB92DRAFT_3037564 [Gautieria morchelliformis]|nr:hypothetical protein JB92DRAFT_3037564 [Gautieria morchelliformis]